MSNDADNVRVAVTGAVSYAEYGTSGLTAPTGTASTIAPRVGVGYISEDGVTLSFPSTGDKSNLKAWQDGATVRTLRSKSDDLPQFHCVLLETRKEAIELAFSSVTQTATEGQYDYDSNKTPDPKDMVVDVIDGAELLRNHLPRAVLAQIGDLVYKNAEPIGYEVTFDLERDATAGYNMRTWATALKAPAAWAATHAYAVGDEVTLTGGAVLQATVAGTSGSTAPTAPAIGGTVVDGTVTWVRLY